MIPNEWKLTNAELQKSHDVWDNLPCDGERDIRNVIAVMAAQKASVAALEWARDAMQDGYDERRIDAKLKDLESDAP